MNDVNFINHTNSDIKEIDTLEKLINFAISYEQVNKVVFSVVFVDDDEMRNLNKKYRNIDKTTDVLSFAFEDSGTINNPIRMLGDIYISVNKAQEQANEYGHAYIREISFLMIHGFLHLLGYDHIEELEEKRMFNRQEEILDEFGIKKQ